MAAQMTPRFRDLPDVNWPSFADGEVATYDTGTDTITGETAAVGGGGDVTQQDLADHSDDTSFVHGIVNTGDLATDTELTAHSNDTTAVHGIANTANIILSGDSRLSDSRTPTPHAASHAPAGSDPIVGADLADAVVLEPDVSDRNVIEGSTNVTLLRLKAQSDQSVPLMEWRNSDDDVLADIHLNDVGASAELKLVGEAPQVNVEIADTAGAYQQAGAFYAYGPDGVLTDPAVFVSAWSDINARFQALVGGAVQWGDGTAAPDTTLERTGAGVLEVNGEPVVLDDDARLVGGVDQGDIDSTVATHSDDTTAVHGIADTSALASLPIAEANVTGLTAALAGKQPVDSDLTALAALSTTSYGRSLLELADAAAGRTALGAAATSHASAHADGGADELVTALDPLTYPSALKLDRAYVVGQYYPACLTPHGGLGGAGAQTVGKAMYTLFIVWTQTTFDRIGVYVTATGSAGSVYRLGINNDNNGVPGTVLLDAGTVATDAGGAGIKAITISQTLAPGRYWGVSVAQVAAPTVRRTISMNWSTFMSTDWNGAGYNVDGITGALPSSPSVVSNILNPTMVGLRAA